MLIRMKKTDIIGKKASELLRNPTVRQAYIKQMYLFDKTLSETNRLTSCLPLNVNAAAVKRDLFSSYNVVLQTSFNRKKQNFSNIGESFPLFII